MIIFLKAALAFVTGRWRLVLMVGTLLLVVLAGAVFMHERHARIEAERERDEAVARAAAAVAQTELDRTAAAAATKADARAATFTLKAREAVHEVQSSPGAHQRLADAVRSAWLAGLDGMRKPAAGVPAAADHPAG